MIKYLFLCLILSTAPVHAMENFEAILKFMAEEKKANKKLFNKLRFDELIPALKKLDSSPVENTVVEYINFLAACESHNVTWKQCLDEHIRRKKEEAIKALEQEWKFSWPEVEQLIENLKAGADVTDLNKRYVIFNNPKLVSKDLKALIEDYFMKREIPLHLFVTVDREIDSAINPDNNTAELTLCNKFDQLTIQTQKFALGHECAHLARYHSYILGAMGAFAKNDPSFFESASFLQYKRACEFEADVDALTSLEKVEGAISFFEPSLDTRDRTHPKNSTRLKWAEKIGKLLLFTILPDYL